MNALAAGVVPRAGAPYIAIGRKEETESLLTDLESVADGGSVTFTTVSGDSRDISFLMVSETSTFFRVQTRCPRMNRLSAGRWETRRMYAAIMMCIMLMLVIPDCCFSFMYFSSFSISTLS